MVKSRRLIKKGHSAFSPIGQPLGRIEDLRPSWMLASDLRTPNSLLLCEKNQLAHFLDEEHGNPSRPGMLVMSVVTPLYADSKTDCKVKCPLCSPPNSSMTKN